MTIEIGQLHEFLRCDPQSGRLFWKARDRKWFKSEGSWARWNARNADQETFVGKTTDGYTKASILGVKYLGHRIVWAMTHGCWPDHIDHINGIRADNRAENLRSVSDAENHKNVARSITNKSGVIGVCLEPKSQKWHARIYVSRRLIHLGYFSHLEDAAAARKEAEKRYGFHQNHGRQPAVAA